MFLTIAIYSQQLELLAANIVNEAHFTAIWQEAFPAEFHLSFLLFVLAAHGIRADGSAQEANTYIPGDTRLCSSTAWGRESKSQCLLLLLVLLLQLLLVGLSTVPRSPRGERAKDGRWLLWEHQDIPLGNEMNVRETVVTLYSIGSKMENKILLFLEACEPI